MRKIWLALVLSLAMSSALILLIAPSANADEPRYNLGVIYAEVFPNVKQGATGEGTIYFYSAYGNVTCFVSASADNYPSGWLVKFNPENIAVVPKWFENELFEVSEGENCLPLTYKDDNGISRQGWVRAYPMKVRVTVPKDTESGSYDLKISYVGDFRMGGMSALNRSGGVEWTVEVESGAPGAHSISSIFFIVAIVVITVVTVAMIKLKR